MTTNLERKLDYDPRHQYIPFHTRSERWSCIVAHRRSGKTVSAVAELIIRALHTKKKNARYAYIAPYYAQAKDIAWQYLTDMGRPFTNSVKDIRQSELSIKLINGAVIRLYGADNPDALRGIYLDGVVLDEYGDCRPSLYDEVILPTLADRKGWAHFIGTPKGKNHFYDIYMQSKNEGKRPWVEGDEWFNLTLKASDSQILPESELRAMSAQMSDEKYAQELECDFTAAVLGTYFAKQVALIEDRNQVNDQIVYDEALPVFAVADLGYTDSTAIWFWQNSPDGIRIIDYEEHHSQPLIFYIELLQEKPWKIEKWYLPHDAKAKTLQTGKSTIEQIIAAGFHAEIIPRMKKQHAIDAARLVLPLCYFHATLTRDGLEALRAYHRAYNEVTKSFTNEPKHDWSSHGSDSFQGLALVCNEHYKLVPPDPFDDGTPAMLKPGGYNLHELHAERTERIQDKFRRDRI